MRNAATPTVLFRRRRTIDVAGWSVKGSSPPEPPLPPSELRPPRARRAAPRHPPLVLRRLWARRAVRLGHALSDGGVRRLNLLLLLLYVPGDGGIVRRQRRCLWDVLDGFGF
jgi:hypothetical protein